MKKIFLFLGSIVIAMVFAGCGDLKCDDKDVTNTVTDIIKREMIKIDPSIKKKKLDFKYSAFMTDDFDKQTKEITCKANLKIKGLGEPFDEFVTYTVRPTDDGKSIYVEVYDE